jgi:S-adenosylmethionine:tRNA ribosyltransferase-isomerase
MELLKKDNCELYELPEEQIALYPSKPRDACRLMVVMLPSLEVKDIVFTDLKDFFSAGDIIAVNNSRVLNARINGAKKSGGKVEFLLLEKIDDNLWRAMGKPASRLREGMSIDIKSPAGSECTVRIAEKREKGIFVLEAPPNILEYGIVPLPPYIASRRSASESDFADYQTTFALKDGSVASPTSALHFTPELVEAITKKGALFSGVTLHVGPGTFRTSYNRPDPELYSVSGKAAQYLNSAKRLCACGTTVMRTLETVWSDGQYYPDSGRTDLYIKAPHRFSPVKMFITNFHMSGTPLIELVAAFVDKFIAGRGMETTLALYRRALQKGYMFLSYGDAMMLVDERSLD